MSRYVELEDSFEAINGYLYAQRMTDGLPVVPPTEERVAAMVAGSGRPAGALVGEVPPLNARATIEKIAINAVMAGCEPAYMPAIVAAVEALLDTAFSAHGIQTTTNPVGPVIMFNGPIRHMLEINCGAGCLSSGDKANVTIGRALRLVMVNVGGATVGDVDKAALGWPGKITCCCFGENEEDSPWEPYHVEHGFRKEDSTVTLIPASGMWPITDSSPDPENVLHHLTYGMATTGHAGGLVPERHEQILIVSPVIAQNVARLVRTKDDLKRHIYENAWIELAWYPPNRHEGAVAKLKELGISMRNGKVPICEGWEKIVVICAGGKGGLQSCGLSCMLGRAVTRKIDMK